MTYIVNDKCIKCKLTDCVDVCPVDCFYEGKNMLVIKPDECIDCGVCEPECPIDAIIPDTENGNEKWIELNTKYSEIWPNITKKKDPPDDSKEHENEENKLLELTISYFTQNLNNDFINFTKNSIEIRKKKKSIVFPKLPQIKYSLLFDTNKSQVI